MGACHLNDESAFNFILRLCALDERQSRIHRDLRYAAIAVFTSISNHPDVLAEDDAPAGRLPVHQQSHHPARPGRFRGPPRKGAAASSLPAMAERARLDRKSTRLNSSHLGI